MTKHPPLINTDAERVVLGKIIADDSQYFEVVDRLTDKDFGDPHNAAIFRAMVELAGRGTPITRATLAPLVAADKFAQGGVETSAYLAALMSEGNQGEYAKLEIKSVAEVVAHGAGRRKLIDIARIIKDRAVAASITTPIEELIGTAQSILNSGDNADSGEVRFVDLMTEVLQEAASEKQDGIRTGFSTFDNLVGPMLPGHLIVIGGETSAGKTALATELAYLIGKGGIEVAVYSLEMTAKEIGYRWAASASSVPVEKVIERRLTKTDLDMMQSALGDVGALPITIDDKPGLTASTIQARLSRLVRKKGVKIAVIDHLHYVPPENTKADERVQIRNTVEAFKAMAKRLGIPIILVSHVHRQASAGEIRTADDIRRPELRDLYGSSAIEKAADAVLFVHRPSYFLDRSKPAEKYQQQHELDRLRWQGKAELVLCKRRNGRGFGVEECNFNEELTWFEAQNTQQDEWIAALAA